jgi:hypothetical protein
VRNTTPHPTRSSTPEVRRQVAAPWHACDHLFNGGRKRVPGRARRALCNKSHKEQYVTDCIINTPRVGYFLTGVTVPQAASGFGDVCPHLIHRDIHRICGRLGRARNDRALSRSVESLRKFVSASYAALCVSFAALPQWRARTVTSQVLVTAGWNHRQANYLRGSARAGAPPPRRSHSRHRDRAGGAVASAMTPGKVALDPEPTPAARAAGTDPGP